LPIRQFAAELELYDLQEGINFDGLDEQGRQLAMGEAVHFVLDLVEGHAGEEDDREAGAMFLEVGQDAEAVEFGHVEVEEEKINLPVLEVV
jgi:hypothetical protein